MHRGYRQWPLDGSLPDYVQAYVEWLVTPDWERPADQKSESAYLRVNHHGTNQGTLWRKDKRVQREIEKRCQELNLSTDRIQEVISAIFKAAKNGDMKAAQLYLQHVDKLAPKRVVIEDARLSEMSDEELRRELEAEGLLG
jgi:hypothetical protein